MPTQYFSPLDDAMPFAAADAAAILLNIFTLFSLRPPLRHDVMPLYAAIFATTTPMLFSSLLPAFVTISLSHITPLLPLPHYAEVITPCDAAAFADAAMPHCAIIISPHFSKEGHWHY